MSRTRSFNEDEVLDQLADLFWSQGYEATSISDLEERVGLGRQSLYNAFGDKRAIFLRALSRYRDQGGAQLKETILKEDAGLNELAAYFDTLARFLTDGTERRACLIGNSLVELAASDAGVLGECQRNERRVMGGLEYSLRNAVERGELASDLDIGATSRALMAHTYGLSALSKSGATIDELRAATKALLERLK